MNLDKNSFLVSIEFSIVVVCLFSIFFLGSFNRKKNKWLLLAFAAIGWPFFNVLIGVDRYHLIPTSSFLQNPAPMLLFYPALYFYALDLVKPKKAVQPNYILHLIPFLAFYFLFAVIGFKPPTKIPNESSYLLFFLITLVVTNLFYGYLAIKLVKFNQEKYQNKFATADSFITLKWMIWVMIGFPIMGGLILALSILTGISNIVFFLITILLSIGTLSFFSFRQPTLYTEEQLPQKPKKKSIQASSPNNPSNTLPTLDEDKIKLIAQLEKYIDKEEPFLNPQIRMPELAEAVEIPRHLFSELINDHYQMNFFHFINTYRIEYAKKLLAEKENQQYTLETIGQMSGFNSRSTFNTRFREIVGKSPKEYKQENVG